MRRCRRYRKAGQIDPRQEKKLNTTRPAGKVSGGDQAATRVFSARLQNVTAYIEALNSSVDVDSWEVDE